MAKKHDLPSQPWYWGDWFKAMDVQALPRDIRCTWFEMIGRMWESKNRGELSINNRGLSIEQLAQLLGFGGDVEECKRHLDYLEEFSIFSRKKNGVIFCRKMVKDEKIRVSRSSAGTKGMKSRYNKSDNKTLTNTEDESEDLILKEGECEGKQRPNISASLLEPKKKHNPATLIAQQYRMIFRRGFKKMQSIADHFHEQLQLYPDIEKDLVEYVNTNPDNLPTDTMPWTLTDKFHEKQENEQRAEKRRNEVKQWGSEEERLAAMRKQLGGK